MKPDFAIILLCVLFSVNTSKAQADQTPSEQDSTAKAKEQKKAIYSESRKASILSALLPGLGQVYNRKYYKVLIIYGLGAGAGYLFSVNNAKYQEYHKALVYSVNNGGTAYIDGIPYSTDNLSEEKKHYKKFRDYAVLGLGIIYLLNIVDANVDAHLKTFDVSDDLGLQIGPWQGLCITGSGSRMALGVSLKLKFN